MNRFSNNGITFFTESHEIFLPNCFYEIAVKRKKLEIYTQIGICNKTNRYNLNSKRKGFEKKKWIQFLTLFIIL